MLQPWYAKLSLRAKITSIALATTALSLAVVATAGVLQIRGQITAEEHRSASALALGVARAAERPLVANDQAEISRLTYNFVRDDGDVLFIAVYGGDTHLLATAIRDRDAWGQYLSGSIDLNRCMVSERQIENFSATNKANNQMQSRRFASLADARRTIIGRVVVGLSTAPAIEAQVHQNRLIVAVTIAAVIVGAIILFLTLGNWMRRLQQLADASRAVAAGDFDGAVDDGHDDEIGRLAQSFDHMRQALRKRDAERRDFTKTLQAQVAQRTQDLQRALTAAEDANHAKSLFLANMSHELRTPLNGVIGTVDLLLAAEPNPRQKRYCDIAKSSARSLMDLINDILDFSKIEAGKLELDATDFDLHEVLEGAARMLTPQAHDKGLELICNIAGDVPRTVCGDPTRLRQVIVNLANNAIKFTDTGNVVIAACAEERGETDTVVRFTVKDSGIGIPKDRLDRLFKRFSQVDASTTRKFGGTGLGLAISQRIVELMNGQIGVISRQGEGSSFWFTVRFANRVTPGISAPITSGNALRLDGVRVLLAEDNDVNRIVASELLQMVGCNCVVVINGQEAVDQAMLGKHDVILMDCQMPVMDGFEAARRIRQAEKQSHSRVHKPIIALTANTIKGDRERCMAAGMDDYVSKPIDPIKLFSAIRALLPAPTKLAEAKSSATAEEREGSSTNLVINLETLRSRCLGNGKLAVRALERFDAGIGRELEILTGGLHQGDARVSATAAHKIKGAAANVSAERVQEVAAKLEMLAKTDALSQSQLVLEQLDQEMKDFREQLTDALHELSPQASFNKA